METNYHEMAYYKYKLEKKKEREIERRNFDEAASKTGKALLFGFFIMGLVFLFCILFVRC